MVTSGDIHDCESLLNIESRDSHACVPFEDSPAFQWSIFPNSGVFQYSIPKIRHNGWPAILGLSVSSCRTMLREILPRYISITYHFQFESYSLRLLRLFLYHSNTLDAEHVTGGINYGQFLHSVSSFQSFPPLFHLLVQGFLIAYSAPKYFFQAIYLLKFFDNL